MFALSLNVKVHSLNVKQFYLTHKVLPLRSRVDLEVIAMKTNSTFPKDLELLELHHKIVSYHIQDTHWEEVLPLCRDAIGVFYSPSRQSQGQFEEGRNQERNRSALWPVIWKTFKGLASKRRQGIYSYFCLQIFNAVKSVKE